MDPTDPIHAILTWPEPELTPPTLAGILGVSATSISEAVRLNRLEALGLVMRGGSKLRRYRISKAAAIRWLWSHTTGDRATLRATLARHAPGLLAELEAPRNLIPFTLPARRPKPLTDHPDLFAAN